MDKAVVAAAAVAGLGRGSGSGGDRFRPDDDILIEDGCWRVAVAAGGLRLLGMVLQGDGFLGFC